MKKTSQFTLITILFLGLISCEKKDPIVLEPVASETITNLHAPQEGGAGQGAISGPFTLFDFETGEITTDPNAWDIGFRGTTIIVNGGESQNTTDEPERTGNAAGYFTTGGFAGVTEADESLLVQDATNSLAIPTGSDNGWYNYSGFGNPNPAQDNLITPLPGRVLVFKTNEGNFAKVEIISYYENAPENPNGFTDASRYYTFNYVYNPNEGEKSLE